MTLNTKRTLLQQINDLNILAKKKSEVEFDEYRKAKERLGNVNAGDAKTCKMLLEFMLTAAGKTPGQAFDKLLDSAIESVSKTSDIKQLKSINAAKTDAETVRRYNMQHEKNREKYKESAVDSSRKLIDSYMRHIEKYGRNTLSESQKILIELREVQENKDKFDHRISWSLQRLSNNDEKIEKEIEFLDATIRSQAGKSIAIDLLDEIMTAKL
ncbi:hypothetical protein [Comamonas suwonensis]|uniref:hypothetical protein n=1 Tax=Comamonas suwonensis TaxID=2606214 RepID=UPI00145E11E7|nr:hypothetical protein [Comamonas suwonensis]MBI1624773.1 hypothetical protein [Comamonas suwonensis]